MEGQGKVVAATAPAFTLPDHQGKSFDLNTELAKGSVILAFYPGGPLPLVCSGQFCDYRDNSSAFRSMGINIIGVSSDGPKVQAEFAKKNNYPFLFLSDAGNEVAKKYGCTSWAMLGGVSRAICLINAKGILLYKYVEPTTLTRKGSAELLGICTDMKKNGLI